VTNARNLTAPVVPAVPAAPAALLPAPNPATLPGWLQRANFWTEDMISRAGLPMYDVPIVSVGGGMGSFVTTNYLRVVGGVPAEDIRVLSNASHPWQTYEYLATMSQIPRWDRIRSDSASRPDNLWGFPSYALQETLKNKTLLPLMRVLLEPVFAHFYTPVLGTVLDSIKAEAERMRYWDMLVQGEVWTVRRRTGGGYFVVLAPRLGAPAGATGPLTQPVVFRCRDVHIAVGYSGLRFLPDLQEFRLKTNDYHHMVNAYENHEHIYSALMSKRPITVLVRGGGIVSSRVLERLISDRKKHGLRTNIVQLLRTYYDDFHGPHQWARRKGKDGFAYQGFNYPKSAWGGQLRFRMDRLEGDDRVEVYDEIGGTTTAWRTHWQRQLRTAHREGWYHTEQGIVEKFGLDGDQVVATVKGRDGVRQLRADYVIDCTGLDGDVAEHRVLRDLLEHCGARRNPLGRLDVERSFELRGAANGEGRIYVTGAASFGGYFPGVDTFLGLQISAQEVVDDMARRGLFEKMGPVRSLAQWFKWAGNRKI